MNRATATQNLDALVAEHRDLDEQVDALVQRRYLTPSERRRVANLKKLRLAARDKIAVLLRKTGT
jgi:uncharacterized protein YdcH (DUF465 family)